jgi:DNA repair photolyase
MAEFKSFHKTVGGNEGSKCNYPTRLDTYGCGCSHDCSYCYAKSLLEFRGLWNPQHPAITDRAKITKLLKSTPTGSVLRLGGMTDCFQPIEKIYRVTYNAIKAMNRRGIGYLIVTKSAIVADDEYLEILDKKRAHIQITVTTTDDDLYKRLGYEKASLPSERIKAILKLQEAGFDVSIRLSPYIPEFIDLEYLKSLGIKKALVEFLRVNHWIQQWFPIDYSGYTVKQSGYRQLPLNVKKAHLDKIRPCFEEITVCEDVTKHYDYFRQNYNHNPEDCCNLRM